MTVSAPVFGAFIFSAAAELLFPVVLLLVLCIRKKVNVIPMFLGAAAFFVSQICLRIPILQILGAQSWYKAFVLNTIPYIIMLSFTAGLFEESARFVCAGCFLKKHRQFRDAISFGLGHGFCEVILLTGMAQINNIIYTVMINNGSFQSLVSTLPAEQGQKILDTMLQVAPAAVYLGVCERIFAVTFHIFASVLIFKGVNEHKVRYYFYAILAHTVFNIVGVLLAQYVNMWASEGAMFVFAAASLFLIFKIRPSFRNIETDTPPARPVTQSEA